MIRRILLVACALLFISGAPAAAEHEYGHVLSGDIDGTAVVIDRTALVIDRTALVFTADGDVVTAADGETLARTGADSVVPMVQAAIVLIGGGSLLVLVARRRRAVRRPATA